MNREQAEDTVQYVFIRIWEYRSDLQYGLSLKNYLYTLAKNYVLNVIRNENTAFEKNCEIAQAAPEYEDNLVETIEKKELLDNLYQAINQLPDRYKEICLMKIKENMSNKEIAERMNLSINTIKTHYSEALRLLRLSFSRMLIFLFALILFSYLSVYLTK
jgi:RNA polymerase sigma-70 factor (ECF subfamily)